MPSSLSPIATIVLAGLLLSILTVSHTGRYLSDKSHRVAHASMKPAAPEGWQVAIEQGGKTVYLKEHQRTYATQRRYQRMMAGK